MKDIKISKEIKDKVKSFIINRKTKGAITVINAFNPIVDKDHCGNFSKRLDD